MYVIATKTKIDLDGIQLPDRLTDQYFKRQDLKKPKQNEGEIFDTKKEVCTSLWKNNRFVIFFDRT